MISRKKTPNLLPFHYVVFPFRALLQVRLFLTDAPDV
jgi:hypothetical protein